jgi:hypothetical protein
VKHLLKQPLLLGAALLVLFVSASRACGFHSDVSIARGVLNWAYPEALHVIGAITAATAARRLTHRASPTDPFGAHYRATVTALERLAELLGAGSDAAPPLSFSLVLVEPMLWTQFEAGPHGLHAQVHVSGPQPDHLVLVSGEDVIRAIANEELGIGEAYRLGLIRSYGSEENIARFLRLAEDAGHAATPHAAAAE